MGIEPTDADDVIVVYAQAVQSYAGPDQQSKIMAQAHNNNPLEMDCEHCNKICEVKPQGFDDEQSYGATTSDILIEETYVDGSAHQAGSLFAHNAHRLECEDRCYDNQDCVAVNYNRITHLCQLLKKCDKMITIAEAEGLNKQ